MNLSLEDTFLKACQENDLTKVRACIDLGVDVNFEGHDGDFGLLISAGRNHLELFDVLLRHPDIDVNKKGVHHQRQYSALDSKT